MRGLENALRFQVEGRGVRVEGAWCVLFSRLWVLMMKGGGLI